MLEKNYINYILFKNYDNKKLLENLDFHIDFSLLLLEFGNKHLSDFMFKKYIYLKYVLMAKGFYLA